MKQFIASILLISVFFVSSGFLYTTKATDSGDSQKNYKSRCLADTGLNMLGDKIINFISGAVDSALGFLSFGLLGGGEDPVTDKTAQTIATKADLKNCIRYVTDTIFKAALANFKKRLLDKLTDDVVQWIKNGQEPRFVSDFGGFLGETTNEVLGQTAEEVGLGQLCSGSLTARLQLQLQSPPPFTEAVNCTLNDIVRNVGNFDRDFRSGGWIGYNEVIKPQNNRWGQELMALDQISNEQTKKNESKRNEVVSSGGYTSEKRCVTWARVVSNISTFTRSIYKLSPGITGWGDIYYNPKTPPPNNLRPVGTMGITRWNCDKFEVTIPGRTVGDLAAPALQNNDALAITNSDDLSPYISAIFDAAINRLFKEGVNGLRGLTGPNSNNNIYSESGTKRPPTTWASSTDERERNYGTYGQEFGSASNPIESLKNEIRATIASTTQRMYIATSSLLSIVSTGGAHARLVASTTALVVCEKQEVQVLDPDTGIPLVNITCPKTLDVVKQNTDRETSIRNSITSLNELVRRPDGLLIQAAAAVETANISEVSLISILAGVNQAYTQVENIITNIPSIVRGINTIASTTVNPWLRGCNAVGTYSCP